LSQKRFENICESFLTCWETGRLRELISDISTSKDFDADKMLEFLQEVDVLTALSIAEATKTKIEAIGQLKEFVTKQDYENKIRDFIYEKPWIINPKWEQFQKEVSVTNVIKKLADDNLKNDELFKGRIDMVLSSGSSLLLIEFMRPGVKIDRDHLDRLNYYVIDVKKYIK